jgi:tetratricopeptide (TPR) repeat protein
VGGGSLVYANVSVNARESTFTAGWPPEITYAAMLPHYDSVGAMLAVRPVPQAQWAERTRLVKDAADRAGYGDRFRKLDLAVRFDERLALTPGSALRPPTYDAYQAFDRGVQHFVDQRYAEAAPEFRSAAALDTTFTSALFYAATALINTDEHRRADSLVRALARRRGGLTEFQRLWLDQLQAVLAGDGAGALRAMRRAAELAPNSRAGYNLAVAALSMDRPEEALAALVRMDPDRGDMRNWSSYWTQLAHAYHMLGRHDEELAAARELGRRFPDRRVALTLAVRALAAAGRTTEIDSAIEAAAPLTPRTYWSQGGALLTAAQELAAHGNPGAARVYYDRAITWLEQQIALEPGYAAHYEWLGNAYYDTGRWARALRAYDQGESLRPEREAFARYAAAAAARVGRDAEARLGRPNPWERGSYEIAQGRIALARGEEARAVAIMTEAVAKGVPNLPWVHSVAVRDLSELGDAGLSLPRALRVGRAAGRSAAGP